MLTVKELREAIKDAPDHMPVMVRVREADMDEHIHADEAKNEFNRIVIDA